MKCNKYERTAFLLIYEIVIEIQVTYIKDIIETSSIRPHTFSDVRFSQNSTVKTINIEVVVNFFQIFAHADKSALLDHDII